MRKSDSVKLPSSMRLPDPMKTAGQTQQPRPADAGSAEASSASGAAASSRPTRRSEWAALRLAAPPIIGLFPISRLSPMTRLPIAARFMATGLVAGMLTACALAPASRAADPADALQTALKQAALQTPASGNTTSENTASAPAPASSSTRPLTVLAASGSVSPRVSLRADSAMTAPLLATFTADLPADGTASWLFPDGGAVSGLSVTRTFYQPGRYSVQATMKAGGRTYTATLPLEIRSGGQEQAVAVLLQDSGSVALSAQGSVVYAPYTPSFMLDGRAVASVRQPLQAGTHTVQVGINSSSRVLTRSYSFRSRAALSSTELARRQDYEAGVLRLTNAARAAGWDCQRQAYGGPALPPLKSDAQLTAAARAQSVGMALNGYFAHRSAVDGSLPDARIRASGSRPAGDAENIAAGQPTPESVVSAWLGSLGHCPNIMGDYDDIGVAYARQDSSPYGDYWTQVFGEK